MGLCCAYAVATYGYRKKKVTSGTDASEEGQDRSKIYQSIFSQKKPDTARLEKPKFLPPETFQPAFDLAEFPDSDQELQNASPWDVAVRYHEFKSSRASQKKIRHLRKLSAAAILQRAQALLGAIVHPVDVMTCPLSELPGRAEQTEFDLDETLENSALGMAGLAPLTNADIWMNYQVPRRQPIILAVDTSLSMTGEKLALTAVALAVVLLEFPEDPIGIVAFENEAKILKSPHESISIDSLVERFLDVPAQGYTHLEDGMRAALTLVRQSQASGMGKPPSVVLLTDGKYTAGKDPSYLAPRFPHLVLLKMGHERASLELCKDLAKQGKGLLREVGELEALPQIMYGVVKDLLRGKSII